MVLDYFIINIHMQLKRREAGLNSSNFLKPRGIHAEKRGGSGAGARVLGFFSFFLTYTHTHQRIKEEDGSLMWHVSGASLFISTHKKEILPILYAHARREIEASKGFT